MLATSSVPLPLKLRTGFAVSSLMLTVHPSARPSASHRYIGVSRKTGSITPRAAPTRPPSSRVPSTPRSYPRPTTFPPPVDSAAPPPNRRHVRGARLPPAGGVIRRRPAVGVVRRRPVIRDHHPTRHRTERRPRGARPRGRHKSDPRPTLLRGQGSPVTRVGDTGIEPVTSSV